MLAESVPSELYNFSQNLMFWWFKDVSCNLLGFEALSMYLLNPSITSRMQPNVNF